MKKIFSIIFLGFIFLSLIPIQVNAGLVPCGCEGCPCTLCHFFIMFDRIIDFILIDIIPPVAILMLVIGGVMFLAAAGNPETIGKAKKIITATILGLVIIFAAWLIINTFMMFIGVEEWTGLREGWWSIDCPVDCECP
ncbi:hypothetical protein KAU51_03345 [Candidatus Parcubacteria bacterium]|nr:hypothetical protein [Candidatus Parcubacteria bacterium]